MKIGIITFINSQNYGAMLQAYAMNLYFKRQGYQPFFINYHFSWEERDGIRKYISSSYKGFLDKLNNILLKKNFNLFRKKHFLIEGNYWSIAELKSNPPIADVYISGSDQVWNPNYLNASDLEAVFLNFGEYKIKRFSYAPSFGVDELSQHSAKYKSLLLNFDRLSIREKTGLQILKNLGFEDSVLVPDPTLLLLKRDYVRLMSKYQSSKQNYIFNYSLGYENSAITNKILKILSQESTLQIEEITFNSFVKKMFSKKMKVEDWLTKIYDSSFVITNSYHGTIFSIIFQKPFFSILRSDCDSTMNDRIRTLLGELGLEERIISEGNLDKVLSVFHKEIDWNRIDDKLESFRAKGSEYIASLFN